MTLKRLRHDKLQPGDVLMKNIQKELIIGVAKSSQSDVIITCLSCSKHPKVHSYSEYDFVTIQILRQ